MSKFYSTAQPKGHLARDHGVTYK